MVSEVVACTKTQARRLEAGFLTWLLAQLARAYLNVGFRLPLACAVRLKQSMNYLIYLLGLA